MLQTHTFKIIWSQTKHAPDTAPTTTQQSKPRAANPRVLQRTERLLEEGPAAVGVALKLYHDSVQGVMVDSKSYFTVVKTHHDETSQVTDLSPG